MKKPLTPRLHGYIDYAAVLAFALAPSLFGFTDTPSTLCYVLALVHLSITLLTDFPLGLAHLIPFPVHGGIEAGVSVALVAMPWLLGFDGEMAARNFFAMSGGALAVTWLATNYKGVERPFYRGHRSPSYG